jgi:hypothetical protein
MRAYAAVRLRNQAPSASGWARRAAASSGVRRLILRPASVSVSVNAPIQLGSSEYSQDVGSASTSRSCSRGTTSPGVRPARPSGDIHSACRRTSIHPRSTIDRRVAASSSIDSERSSSRRSLRMPDRMSISRALTKKHFSTCVKLIQSAWLTYAIMAWAARLRSSGWAVRAASTLPWKSALPSARCGSDASPREPRLLVAGDPLAMRCAGQGLRASSTPSQRLSAPSVPLMRPTIFHATGESVHDRVVPTWSRTPQELSP